MARHDKKTSAGRAKMLSRGDTGNRLAEVDDVLAEVLAEVLAYFTFATIVFQKLFFIKFLSGSVR